ncbi:putative alkaline shock family protein YloU [Spinactinospora alkalitolerans]|uniref:Putative alkaline shock family protein YloU n=1 Tax=Spinactinospora alkalitolerans TaxID=687207 RepID=A0A852TXX1_9ACTN|nr:Asp23/Gls24 family envelope stress response protein [Spinactinospora alkalitolerans]NYE49376.1 putative alkaline shock family protein YloU [Spinactinospora alkalitolerans]
MTGPDPAAEAGERIAARVRACADVLDLSAGAFNTVATPVPGGRIDGVALRTDTVEIGVVVRYGRPLPEIATEIRAAVAPMVPDRAVHVSIEDVSVGLPGPPTRSGE